MSYTGHAGKTTIVYVPVRLLVGDQERRADRETNQYNIFILWY